MNIHKQIQEIIDSQPEDIQIDLTNRIKQYYDMTEQALCHLVLKEYEQENKLLDQSLEHQKKFLNDYKALLSQKENAVLLFSIYESIVMFHSRNAGLTGDVTELNQVLVDLKNSTTLDSSKVGELIKDSDFFVENFSKRGDER